MNNQQTHDEHGEPEDLYEQMLLYDCWVNLLDVADKLKDKQIAKQLYDASHLVSLLQPEDIRNV